MYKTLILNDKNKTHFSTLLPGRTPHFSMGTINGLGLLEEENDKCLPAGVLLFAIEDNPSTGKKECNIKLIQISDHVDYKSVFKTLINSLVDTVHSENLTDLYFTFSEIRTNQRNELLMNDFVLFPSRDISPTAMAQIIVAPGDYEPFLQKITNYEAISKKMNLLSFSQLGKIKSSHLLQSISENNAKEKIDTTTAAYDFDLSFICGPLNNPTAILLTELCYDGTRRTSFLRNNSSNHLLIAVMLIELCKAADQMLSPNKGGVLDLSILFHGTDITPDALFSTPIVTEQWIAHKSLT